MSKKIIKNNYYDIFSQLSGVDDLNNLWELGIAGIPLVQYLKWADDTNLFQVLIDNGSLTIDQLSKDPALELNISGATALLGVLCALNIISKSDNRFRANRICYEYLDKRSEFYVGDSLYNMLTLKLPKRLTKRNNKKREYSKVISTLHYSIKSLFSRYPMGGKERLKIQHSRNFPAALISSQNDCFIGLQSIVDIAGGSGVFAIPLALKYPDLHITLIDLPKAIKYIHVYLQKYNLENRINLLGVNIFDLPWPFESHDGYIFGNLFHSCSDEECIKLLYECFRVLPKGGKVFVHEMLWNDYKDGPLVTALWNFWMVSVSAGRQRSYSELSALFTSVGFQAPNKLGGFGGFTLLESIK